MDSGDSNKSDQKIYEKELHIAPMLDVTNNEFHNLFRILSKKCVLWTEMVVDETLYYTDNVDEHLNYNHSYHCCNVQKRHHNDDTENKNKHEHKHDELGDSTKQKNSPFEVDMHPIICQIGGRNPTYSAKATQYVQQYKYDEINLNIDCPSNRVSGQRQFGAILMKQIDTAKDVIQSISQNATSIPISIKTRVGIDEFDTLDYLISFIDNMRSCGCRKFIIHARKCILGGLLSPAQNRLVPPLNYPRVYALCSHFQDCEFILNGGIPGLKAAKLIAYGQNLSSSNKLTETNSTLTVNENNVHNTNHKHPDPINNCQLLHENHHSVPCSICNASNGSCVAPPYTAPTNLRGCMIGRAAMENPSMFWDVDRYFYGMDENPCQNRRQVLELYCQFLERKYPRRCCDDFDDDTTTHFPLPQLGFITSLEFGCHICQEFYNCNNISKQSENGISTNTLTINGDCNPVKKIKISSRVVDRSLKPILGMFFGLPKSKTFRRECDQLSRNLTIRNCGPGYIIRKALKKIPQHILDQPFVKTEDLDDDQVPIHIGPDVKKCNIFSC